ncbi:Trp biosynthesis-associated membrane protein [Isoptericola sp. BMS4]|uniref:Trp biosynthesis-associated membrane protein n=1 Tax=Isoptericola sp. BMS4 TaxID=2527875 RepID=UPI001420AD66|nr:Trp biosynthesis-associated membrane protein [Isoptericola sp. BMS4]
MSASGTPRGPLRARSRAVWAVVALGGLTLATAVPTWLTTTVSTALSASVPVEVTGTDAASAVGAAALVVVAGGVALAIAGRIARWVVAVVVALAGGLVTASAAGVLRDPVPAATAGASDAQGVTDLTSPVAVAVWPWLTAVLGVLIVVVAVLVVLGAPGWGATSGRHERAGAPADGSGAAPRAGSGEDGGTADADGTGRHDPHDAWDALTRGTDPSDER